MPRRNETLEGLLGQLSKGFKPPLGSTKYDPFHKTAPQPRADDLTIEFIAVPFDKLDDIFAEVEKVLKDLFRETNVTAAVTGEKQPEPTDAAGEGVTDKGDAQYPYSGRGGGGVGTAGGGVGTAGGGVGTAGGGAGAYPWQDTANPTPTPEVAPDPWPVTRAIAAQGLVQEVFDEVRRASKKHRNMAGPHEGYAVILEELDELWDHVKADTGKSSDARKEAIQIAAMAVRYILDLKPGVPE